MSSFLFNIRPPACNVNTKWTPLHVFFKGFAYILLNCCGFQLFSELSFTENLLKLRRYTSLNHGIFYFISRYMTDPFVDSLKEMVADRKKKGRCPRRIRYYTSCRCALCLLLSLQSYDHVIVRVLLPYF